MINKLVIFGIVVLSSFLVSCKGDPETVLEVVVKNTTNESVQLKMFSIYASPGLSDTTEIILQPEESYEWYAATRGGGGNTYPIGLHNAPGGDSLYVVFNDTLRVSHYTDASSYLSSNIDSTVLEYDEPRNIYNPNSFYKEKIKENFFRGTYLISESDRDYAISIYE